MNYTKYEKRELISIEEEGPVEVVVDNCDYDIGITVSYKNNRTRHLICLNGPSGPQWKEMEISEKDYKRYFDKLLTGIMLYKIDGIALDDLWENITGVDDGNMTECAFT